MLTTARLDDVSAAAARGNLEVFEEITREFARFLAEFDGGPTDQDERRIREFRNVRRWRSSALRRRERGRAGMRFRVADELDENVEPARGVVQ